MRPTLPDLRWDEVARFWSKVAVSGVDDCWPWTGRLDRAGYGYFKLRGSMWRAHRVAFLLAGHVLTDDRPLVLHRCVASPACCNPFHLRAGTDADNARDRDDQGRTARLSGWRNGQAKLTDDDVAEIRRRYTGRRGEQTALAREFGICRTVITRIVHNQIWTGPTQ